MLERIKLAMRMKSDAFDEEIEAYIESCKRDMVFAGINEDKITEYDNSAVAVTSAYVKWQMDFQGKGDKWQEIYKSMKLSLALDSNYKS